MLNRGLLKQALFIVLFFLGVSIYADEVNKMTIIDDSGNQISDEGLEYERLDTKDSTTNKVGTKKITKVDKKKIVKL